MSTWITDRLPNLSTDDVDSAGRVWTCVLNRKPSVTHYSAIILGIAWQPITPPAPYVKAKAWTLKVCGNEYNVYKNGLNVWTFFPRHWTSIGIFTGAHITALVDGLNKHEEQQ